ncbi:unnamed protein product [Lota lota]
MECPKQKISKNRSVCNHGNHIESLRDAIACSSWDNTINEDAGCAAFMMGVPLKGTMVIGAGGEDIGNYLEQDGFCVLQGHALPLPSCLFVVPTAPSGPRACSGSSSSSSMVVCGQPALEAEGSQWKISLQPARCLHFLSYPLQCGHWNNVEEEEKDESHREKTG